MQDSAGEAIAPAVSNKSVVSPLTVALAKIQNLDSERIKDKQKVVLVFSPT